GVDRPPSFPFNLNSAVDELLKREFDLHRESQTAHPLIVENNIDAIPFQHELMDEWREALHKGVQFLHPETNFLVTGAVDDIWVNPAQELLVVDYKATSKKGEVSLDSAWQIGYKRQMEVYQWLLRRNGFAVSNTGYFVYCNGDSDKPHFNAILEFKISVIPYSGNDSWVLGALRDAKACLDGEVVPKAGKLCDWCRYRAAVEELALG
ncbi:MAG: PD-(D/E)XK nuclease family protein, partial [Bdellovibrionales bacterium]|nr:PD-(D/E)XK nuclease family protein [Bdellovibrionales bacterium]